MRPALAIIVLAVDLLALVSVFGAPLRTARKLAWCAAIVLLPLAGAAAWFLAGRRKGMVAVRNER